VLDQDLPPRTQWRSGSISLGRRFINFDPASRFPRGFPSFIMGSRVGSGFSLASLSLKDIGSSFGGRVACRFIARRSGQNRDSRDRDITVKARNRRDEAIQCLHSDKRDVRFQEHKISNINQGALLGLFPPRYDRSAHARQSASWRCLGTFLLGASPNALE
jgi:hypothetical protein